MTSRASSHRKPFLAALNGVVTPTPPFWLMRQAGRYLPEYRELRAKAGSFLDLCYNPDFAVEVTLQPLRRYGMDAAILFSDILVLPHALGQNLRFVEGEGPQLDPVRSVDDLKALKPEGIHERLAPVYETVNRLAAGMTSTTALIGFAGAPWTIACYMVEGQGSKEYAAVKRWAYGDPNGFQKLIDMVVEATIAYLSRQVEAGAEVLQLFDSWAGVLPAGEFQRWVVAPTRRIVKALKEAHPEVPVIGFPRGAGFNYESYVRQTGVDAVGLDTTVPVAWAAEVLQPIKPVQGNLDPIHLVAGGGAMRAAVGEILRGFAGKPYIFNLGHGVVPSTPPENVEKLADMIREGSIA